MARASLNNQFYRRMQEKIRFGESKHEAKKQEKMRCESYNETWNPLKVDGIFSHTSYSTYEQTSKQFVKFLKTEYPQIKNIDDITRDVVKEYLIDKKEEGCTVSTLDTYMASLNKILDLDIDKKEMRFENADYTKIIRSRLECEHDKQYNPENWKGQIEIARAIGCRRSSIVGGNYQIKPMSFFRDSKNVMYCRVIEKGGRYRAIPVLKQHYDNVESIIGPVKSRIIRSDKKSYVEEYKNSKEEPLFDKYTNKIDNHAFRAEYSINRYNEIIDEMKREGKQIIMDYKTKIVSNVDENGCKEYICFNREALIETSKALGHSRENIVVENYLIR